MTQAKTLTAGLLLGCLGVATYAALEGRPGEGAAQNARAEDVELVSHPAAGETAPGPIGGEVLEVHQVTAYTYLRFAGKKGEEVWAAVPKSAIQKGQTVALATAERMENFASKQLNRTFEVIYFGTLATGEAPSGPESPHAAEPGSRSGRGAAADLVEIQKTERASGESGHTVAELFEKKSSLSGQTIRIQGTVVQVTMNVMNTNFIHVRDGSGEAAKKTHDVVLQVAENPPEVGKAALFEGVLKTNVDLGAGYSYSVIVEDARVIED